MHLTVFLFKWAQLHPSSYDSCDSHEYRIKLLQEHYSTKLFVVLSKDIICTKHSRNIYLQGLFFGTFISNIACQFNHLFLLSALSDIVIDRTRWCCGSYRILWHSSLQHHQTYNDCNNCSYCWWNEPRDNCRCHNWIRTKKLTVQESKLFTQMMLFFKCFA